MDWPEELFIEKSDMFLVRMNAMWDVAEIQAKAIHDLVKEYNPSARKVLDLMCGNGRIAINLAKLGYEVIGLDFSKKFIEDAERRAKDIGVNVKFIAGDARKLDEYIKDAVDVVISFWTSIGFYDDETDLEILKKTFQILKENGLFMILNTASLEQVSSFYLGKTIDEVGDNVFIESHKYDPESGRNISVWSWYKKIGSDLKFMGEATLQLRLYSKHEIILMLKKAGFEIVAVLHSYRTREPARINSPINVVARKGKTK